MELSAILATTRALVRAGETYQALQTLLPALAQQPHYRQVTRTLQVLESNYQAARQQEIKGILPFQEAQRTYSQVNDALLTILDDLAQGRSTTDLGKRPRYWPWLAGIAALGLVLGIWFFFVHQPPGNRLDGVDCPEFNGDGPRVLILPFQQVSGKPANPELVIQSRIQLLSGNKKFPVATQVLTDLHNVMSPDLVDAGKLAQRCGADMVIWGLYDYTGDSLQLDLRFLALHRPNGAFASGFRAFRGLPDVQSGQFLSPLDDAVFGVCGILAVRSGNADIARTWFGKMKHKNELVQQTEQLLNQQ